MANGETALSYAMSLAHATATGTMRRTPEQIIDEARMYRGFLDETEGHDDGLSSVWVLTSATYKLEPGEDLLGPDENIVGVFASREAAESYRDNAQSPVRDGVITEWIVDDQIVGEDGQYLDVGAGA